MDAVASCVSDTFGVEAAVMPPIRRYYGNDTPGAVESCMVLNPYRPLSRDVPKAPPDGGAESVRMYDGNLLLDVLGGLVEHGDGLFSVIFTDMLAATFGANMKYHARALVAANPCLVSVTGMIEAPARPRDYCIDVLAGSRLGLDMDAVNSRHTGRFLEYGDARLQRVAWGYVTQAVFYFETGEQFCPDRDCVLFNAHWQEELLHSQVESGTLCGYHRDILRDIRGM